MLMNCHKHSVLPPSLRGRGGKRGSHELSAHKHPPPYPSPSRGEGTLWHRLRETDCSVCLSPRGAPNLLGGHERYHSSSCALRQASAALSPSRLLIASNSLPTSVVAAYSGASTSRPALSALRKPAASSPRLTASFAA